MTESEEQELRELANDLARSEQNAWEPMCIARAFSTPARTSLALTMQGWIDLEAMRSPLLQLEAPATAEDLERAARVFSLSLTGRTPEEGTLLWRAMRRSITEAFSLALPMRQDGAGTSASRDGFGAWLPLFAFLVAECGIDPSRARVMRVDHAFALLAACRRNQGWECAGESYLHRDVLQETSEPPKS